MDKIKLKKTIEKFFYDGEPWINKIQEFTYSVDKADKMAVELSKQIDSSFDEANEVLTTLKNQMSSIYKLQLKAKFIAIFDNDAEGYQSQCVLLNEIKEWPENFKILLYPENDLLKKYPTLASNGKIILDDINHKAGSIELYLPDSIIKFDGKYLPIEWESRKKIKSSDGKEELLYQGVISQKDDIKRRFHDLRNLIETGDLNFQNQEWARMKQLLDVIVFAYKNN